MAASAANSERIRAVLFDLDDTLRVSDPHPHDVFTGFVASQGIALSEQDRKDAYRWGHSYWANSTTLLDDHEKHQGYEDPFWKNYTRRHLRSLNLGEATIERLAASAHRHMGNGYRPVSKLVPHTLESIHALRASGLQVGLLTNRTRPIYKEMTELGLDHELDIFLTGGQLGAFKPQADFFLRALDLLKLAPQEVTYVGDNYFADILGAQKAGILPVLIDPRDLYPEWEGARIHGLDELFKVLPLEGLVR